MKEPVEYIAKSIVNAPQDVKVTEETGETGILIKPEVAADDKDRVIEKAGGPVGYPQGEAAKELVEYIAKSIVNAPQHVKVTEETGEAGILIKLEVAVDDKGRVIGKQGRVAEAMRTLLRVNAAKTGTRVRLEIV